MYLMLPAACQDVARFLGVNIDKGMFYFDASYRPVPLEMQFVGVSERNILQAKALMDEVAYQKVPSALCPMLQPHTAGIGSWQGRHLGWR